MPRRSHPVERIRTLCMALPEVEERLSHGEAAWFVGGKKLFVMMSDHHHDDRTAFWCAAVPGAQQVLAGAAPDRYFRPPYVGHRGWLGVYLDAPAVDWDEISGLIEDAWRTVAPKRILALLDADGGGAP
jgi:hypothetical protein